MLRVYLNNRCTGYHQEPGTRDKNAFVFTVAFWGIPKRAQLIDNLGNL